MSDSGLSLAELRAELFAADSDNAFLESDPTGVPFGTSRSEQIEILEQRRMRFYREARSVAADCESESRDITATEGLLCRRLLDKVSAIDEVLPRLRELADADRQHAETMRAYAPPVRYFGD